MLYDQNGDEIRLQRRPYAPEQMPIFSVVQKLAIDQTPEIQMLVIQAAAEGWVAAIDHLQANGLLPNEVEREEN